MATNVEPPMTLLHPATQADVILIIEDEQHEVRHGTYAVPTPVAVSLIAAFEEFGAEHIRFRLRPLAEW
jgi:hypothetical protein